MLGAYTDCNHGQGLAIIHPKLYRHIYQENISKFARFAVEVWKVETRNLSQEEIAKKGMEELDKFIREIGLPTSLLEIGISDKEMLRKVADSSNITAGCAKQLTHDEIYEILLECMEYREISSGYNETSVFTLQSTSKSITSAIFGIAIDKGYIEGVNVPISTYFPQILDSGSEYKSQITNWNLLTHTTGLDASDTANWNDWLASSNWVDYVLNRRALARPGTVFNYFTGNTHLLSAIIQQATGKTTYEFGKEYLFDPLDIDSVECTEDPQGISDGGNGFAMNVYDMAKIGELYLNDGVWNGEQIIPAQWVEDSTTVQFDRSSGSADYGYQWWVRTFGNNNYPSFFAQGHYGQYIFVVPDLELVVVFTSHYEGSSSIYWQLMNQIVNAC